jgi:DNA-binding beta-propeller fold protein YncE
MVVSPDGRSLYVPVVVNPVLFYGVAQCDIDPLTGAVSPKTPAIVSTGKYPNAIAVSPDGRSAYVTVSIYQVSLLAQFDIDPATGALSPKAVATVVTGPQADAIAVSPDDRSAYVTSAGGPLGPFVWQYDIDPASGTLSPKDPPTVATGGAPYDIAVTPDARSAYVTNGADSEVQQYDVDVATGTLSPKAPAVVATDGHPSSIVIGPLPRLPTGPGQCKRGGWRNFPQFNNEGRCVAFLAHGKLPHAR